MSKLKPPEQQHPPSNRRGRQPKNALETGRFVKIRNSTRSIPRLRLPTFALASCLGFLLLSQTSYAEVFQTALNNAGVTILTNTEVRSGELNTSSLRAIFTVRKRSWDDKTPIKVFVLPDQNPLHQQFCKSILKIYPYVLREQWDRLIFSGTGIPPTVVENEHQLQLMIESTPGAIGYASNSPIDVADISNFSANLFVLRTNSEQ